jgi:integration host factor subunit beta
MVADNQFTKASIVEFLKLLFPDLSTELLANAVEIFFDEIVTALVCGDRVELRKFGSWVVRKREGKTVRNPRTNEKIAVGDKGSLYFRASRDFIKDLNNKV